MTATVDILQFDPNTLTAGELESMEIECGIQLADVVAFIQSGGAGSATVLVGLLWVAGRRVDPEFTVEDARATRIVDLEFVEGGGGDAGD